MNESKPLQIQLIDGQLVVSLGINTLCHSVMSQEHWPEGAKIINNEEFAQEIINELDDVDGQYFIGFLLDKAALKVFESGSLNIQDENQ